MDIHIYRKMLTITKIRDKARRGKTRQDKAGQHPDKVSRSFEEYLPMNLLRYVIAHVTSDRFSLRKLN